MSSRNPPSTASDGRKTATPRKTASTTRASSARAPHAGTTAPRTTRARTKKPATGEHAGATLVDTPIATTDPSVTAVAEVRIAMTEDARRALIAEIAYLRAEKRNFAPGGEVADWLAAEAEVAERLRGR